MWYVDLGETVWADTAQGDLRGFRMVGPFARHEAAYDFCRRYPFLTDARPQYMESVDDFEAATIRR